MRLSNYLAPMVICLAAAPLSANLTIEPKKFNMVVGGFGAVFRAMKDGKVLNDCHWTVEKWDVQEKKFVPVDGDAAGGFMRLSIGPIIYQLPAGSVGQTFQLRTTSHDSKDSAVTTVFGVSSDFFNGRDPRDGI